MWRGKRVPKEGKKQRQCNTSVSMFLKDSLQPAAGGHNERKKCILQRMNSKLCFRPQKVSTRSRYGKFPLRSATLLSTLDRKFGKLEI